MTHPREWSPERTAAVAAALTVENWSAATVLFALHELGSLTKDQLYESFATEGIVDQSAKDGLTELVNQGLVTATSPSPAEKVFHLTDDGRDLAYFLEELIRCEKKNKKNRR